MGLTLFNHKLQCLGIVILKSLQENLLCFSIPQPVPSEEQSVLVRMIAVGSEVVGAGDHGEGRAGICWLCIYAV